MKKQYLQLNNKKGNNPIEKWGKKKDLHRHFLKKKKTQMQKTNNYMKDSQYH